MPNSISELQIVDISSAKVWQISPEQWQKNNNNKHLLLRYLAIPIAEDVSHLWLAVDTLNNISGLDTFAFITGKIVEPVLIDSEQLKAILHKLQPQTYIDKNLSPDILTNQQLHISEPTTEEGPTIKLLESVFEQALANLASDIHFEMQADNMLVRIRVDGLLRDLLTINNYLSARIIFRLKLLAKLDVSETRLPQDGRFNFVTSLADNLEFRISTLPTYHGEKIVLRLQKNSPIKLEFSALGMQEEQQQLFKWALQQPQGLILITGPTGSGKSISLYSAINWLNKTDKHILTAEDPIEINIDGVIQCQINNAINLNFSQLLRSFLRQDPDIIMLGEIRDEESAAIALRAAQTGHLVLSSLHTNDAYLAINRLLQLGIKQHEIDSALLLVIAQRLVRRCCPVCKKQIATCTNCYQGYKGRTGIFQFLTLTKDSNNQSKITMDYSSLRASAEASLTQGLTDQEEIVRVLGAEYV